MVAIASLLLIFLVPASQGALFEQLYGETSDYVYGFYAGADDAYWDEARFKCTKYNYDDLVMIKYSNMGPDLSELMDSWGTRNSYIGMHDKYTEDYWSWVDGSDVSDHWQDWGPGQPNDYKGEDCGTYLSTNDYWNDDDCNHSYGFICASPKTRMSPLISTEFFIEKFDSTKGSIQEARQICENLGFRLAVVDSEEKINEIKRNSMWDDSLSYWIDGARNCLNSDNCADNARYICEAVHSFDMKLSSHVKDYMEGDAIEIECTAFGVPTPEVTWHKYIGSMTDDSGQNAYQIMEPGKSTLTIKSATLEDTSRYRCFSKNEINGESRRTKTYLDIRVHPPTITRVNEA